MPTMCDQAKSDWLTYLTWPHAVTLQIEERILKLQEKKQLVFEGTVGRDVEALGKLTEDDMRFLFS